ncbi:MAG: hypothetical protein ABEJ65_12210 [bacterium]
MAVKPSEQEEKYFKKLNEAKKKQLREENRKEAIQGETQEIAEELNTTEDVAEELFDMGFNKDTARILPLLPALEVAWADHKITDNEREHLLETARENGLGEESEAFSYLEDLLDEKPDESFFDRAYNLLDTLTGHDKEWKKLDVFKLSKELADYADHWFDLFDGINDQEAEKLHKISSRLNRNRDS